MKIFLTIKQRNRIIKLINILRKELKINIFLRGNILEFGGESVAEYDAEVIIEAIIQGFSLKNALLLKNVEYGFERINLKNYLREQRLRQIKARIIGKEGRVLKTLKQLTDCDIKINDYSVFILGYNENTKLAKQAILRLIHGSKHSSVYNKLEHKQSLEEDLGLKISI